jgi:tRNA A37 threonylcarbamoyladenosine dehydratase
MFPWNDGRVCAGREPGTTLALDCESGFGTAAFVTAPIGMAAAGEVVRRIALEG